MVEAKISAKENGVFQINGELTFDTVNKLFKQSKNLLLAVPEINIDLSGVVRSDSAGLALLIEWQKLAKKSNKKISFQNLSKQLLCVAKVSGLDQILQLHHPAVTNNL